MIIKFFRIQTHLGASIATIRSSRHHLLTIVSRSAPVLINLPTPAKIVPKFKESSEKIPMSHSEMTHFTNETEFKSFSRNR